MDLRTFIKWLLPGSVKAFIRREIEQVVRQNKAPRMCYGYRDANGEWRPNTRISDTVYINNPERINIADNVYVGHFAILDGTRTIEIGEGTQIGSWVGVFTHSSHFAIRLYGKHYLSVPEDEKLCYESREIRIGRYVFIGAGAQILPGVEIGDGAIIAGGAHVSKNVQPFSLVNQDSKELLDGARKLDKLKMNKLKDPQLEQWYAEWQQQEVFQTPSEGG